MIRFLIENWDGEISEILLNPKYVAGIRLSPYSNQRCRIRVVSQTGEDLLDRVCIPDEKLADIVKKIESGVDEYNRP